MTDLPGVGRGRWDGVLTDHEAVVAFFCELSLVVAHSLEPPGSAEPVDDWVRRCVPTPQAPAIAALAAEVAVLLDAGDEASAVSCLASAAAERKLFVFSGPDPLWYVVYGLTDVQRIAIAIFAAVAQVPYADDIVVAA